MPPRRKTNFEAVAQPTTQVPTPKLIGADVGKPIVTTIGLDARVWADLQGWMAHATVDVGRKVKIGQVGAALFDLLLDNPELQDSVKDRLR